MCGRHDDSVKVEPEDPLRIWMLVECLDYSRNLLPYGMCASEIVIRDVDKLIDVAMIVAIVFTILRREL